MSKRKRKGKNNNGQKKKKRRVVDKEEVSDDDYIETEIANINEFSDKCKIKGIVADLKSDKANKKGSKFNVI